MIDFLEWLLAATPPFEPLWGGAVGPELLAAELIGETIIVTALTVIPIVLLLFARRHPSVIPKPLVRLMRWFGVFIFLCGMTHVMGVLALAWPAYRADALLRIVTGLVSLRAALLLPATLRFLIDSEVTARRMEQG